MFGGVQNKEGEYSCFERVRAHSCVFHLLDLYAQSLLRCIVRETHGLPKYLFYYCEAYKRIFITAASISISCVHSILHTCKNTHTQGCFFLWHKVHCAVIILYQLNRVRLFVLIMSDCGNIALMSLSIT